MKVRILILAVLCSFFLAACAPAKPEASPVEGVPVDAAGLAELQGLFADPHGWYSRILTSDFETPAQIDLYELFYKGIPDEDNTLQAKERAYLETVWSEFEFQMDAKRLPVEKMNEVLQTYLGVSLEDTDKTGLERFTFWEAGNCYYLAHGDTNAIQPLLFAAYTLEDGTIAVYYSNGNFDGKAAAKPDKVTVLRPTADGYQILSNGAHE